MNTCDVIEFHQIVRKMNNYFLFIAIINVIHTSIVVTIHIIEMIYVIIAPVCLFIVIHGTTPRILHKNVICMFMIANYNECDACMHKTYLCYSITKQMINSNLFKTKMNDLITHSTEILFVVGTLTNKSLLFIIRGTLQPEICRQSSLQPYNIMEIIVWVSIMVIYLHGSNQFAPIDCIDITVMIVDIINIILIRKLDANDNLDYTLNKNVRISCIINYDTFHTNKSKISSFYAIDNEINYSSQNKTTINAMINETIVLQIKWLQLLLL